mmetsp:Transcript_6863/g.12258  ORF Transcript_6863/g.12258 Transcript_6863/m.12258 type:complete len:115 (+) Transcript_6863:2-346(+)
MATASLLVFCAADTFDPAYPADCIMMTGDAHWFQQAGFKIGMTFKRERATVKNKDDAVWYYKRAGVDRCIYPDADRRMRTAKLKSCKEGGLNGRGFHYVADSAWRSVGCKGDEL